MLFVFALILSSASAVLTVANFRFSFFLNYTEPLPCGINIGSDELQINPSSAITGTKTFPISPNFYYYDGARCTRAETDQDSYFVLTAGLNSNSISGSSELVRLAEVLQEVVGEENIATFAGAKLDTSEDRSTLVTIVPDNNGGSRIERVSGKLVTEPVPCGSHNVVGAVFVRTDEDVEFTDALGRRILLKGGKMYGYVGTQEHSCFFKGFTRAANNESGKGPPEEDLPDDGGDDEDEDEDEDGIIDDVPSKSKRGPYGLVIGIGAALLAIIIIVTGILYRREKKKEREVSETTDEAQDEELTSQP